jgi:DedD protein
VGKGEKMKGTSKTRTQRRMEKRQAVILLVLVLVVSLASFTLGVIVGRRGAERDLAQKYQQAERVLVAQAPTAVAEPVFIPATGKVVGEPAVEPVTEEPKLSFYDDLTKETAPLGSGINLAPVEDKEVVVVTQPPIDLPDQPIVKKEAMDVATVVEEATQKNLATAVAGTSGSEMPKVVSNGSHAVQIGSFGAAGDAIALKQKMLDKEYPAFVVEADLGKKGLWYRVRIGPYANSAAAKSAQELLEKKEQLKGFIARQ